MDKIVETDVKNLWELYSECRLCPRECGVKRLAGQRGRCRMPAAVFAARASLHMWEEPCLSGSEGSGTVFFSGCTLSCVFCQNAEISREDAGLELSVSELAGVFLRLQARKANNINLVTAGHFLPHVILALREARDRGLMIPVVYNTGGYEKPEALELLRGLVDIYLPDFKYMDGQLAERYSGAGDYPERAKEALAEMVEQTCEAEFDERGIMKRGVIVRHLQLPGHIRDSKAVVRYLAETYGNRIWISLMNQYTPMPGVGDRFPNLARKVAPVEYERLVDYAISLGVENGFIQEGETAKESFIPSFNGEGLQEETAEDGRKCTEK